MSSDHTSFGTIAILPAPNRTAGSAGYARVENYRWTPPAAITTDLPEGYTFEMQCARRPDGERVFIPHQSSDTVLLESAQGGLALLIRSRQMTPELRNSYRVMSFLFQAVQTRREFQRRRFQHARDLYLRLRSREVDNTRTVLPPGLGRSADNGGHDWSIAELIEHGAATAQALGISRPSQEQKIHCGLFAAARRCPLPIPPTDVAGLIRAALFQSRGSPGIDETTRAQIEERIMTAIHQHLTVGTSAEFLNWLRGEKSSFVKQIADQRRAPGGRIPRRVVSDVLLELGWQSYRYMAGCVSYQFQAFRRAIPDPLTPSEQARFDRLYLQHPALGDFPLLMIYQRISAVSQAFQQYWEADDQHMIPVIHQLLFYYAFMSNERREADRRGQQFSRAQQLQGGYRPIGPFDERLGHETWRSQDQTVDADDAQGRDAELDE